jgi:uncharacterized membrane protein YccC
MTATPTGAVASETPPELAGPSSMSEGHEWAALTFALKTFAAALLALFFSFWLGLDEPKWAILTVFVLSQAESGLVLAKSFHRLLGTAAGALVATALVFMFAQHGELFLILLALWVGVCNFAARAARNFMSYGFLLAGYTAAIVGIPAALNPDSAYPLVVARCTEISLGIACAALISRLVLPEELAPKLLALVQQLIVRVTRFGAAAIDPDADQQRFAADRIQVVQDLAAVDAMRSSAFFESPDARGLNDATRQVMVSAFDICAIAEDAAGRSAFVAQSSNASSLIVPALISESNNRPREDAAVVSALLAASDKRAIFDAGVKLGEAALALRGGSRLVVPRVPLRVWSNPLPAVLTGVRTALAVLIASAFWIETAWPSGPTAVIVAVTVCSLIASMDRPATISLALAITILVAAVPIFVTLFYLLPLASDFVSMAMALAPLILACAFVMAHPGVGPMGQLSAVYFSVASNIDNVMTYDAVGFFNTSLGILVGIGIALVLFATVFPETPSQAICRLRSQLLFQLSRLAEGHESPFPSFAYGLCDQLATTFIRVKEEPLAVRQCCAMAMAALSMGYAIDRLNKAFQAGRITPRMRVQIETLLSKISETFLKPSRASLTTRAWEARAVRKVSLKEARASSETEEVAALGLVLIGCETIRSNLLMARILLSETSDAR